jgi:HlyD family secretion protein
MIKRTNGQDEVIANHKKFAVKKLTLGILILCTLSYIAFPTLSQWYASIPSVDSKKIKIDAVIRGDLIRDVVIADLFSCHTLSILSSTNPSNTPDLITWFT